MEERGEKEIGRRGEEEIEKREGGRSGVERILHRMHQRRKVDEAREDAGGREEVEDGREEDKKVEAEVEAERGRVQWCPGGALHPQPSARP